MTRLCYYTILCLNAVYWSNGMFCCRMFLKLLVYYTSNVELSHVSNLIHIKFDEYYIQHMRINSTFEIKSHFGRYIRPKRLNLILQSTEIINVVVELNCFIRRTYHVLYNAKYCIRYLINSTFETGRCL